MKYQIVCKKCGKVIGDFSDWFKNDQRCQCGSNYVDVKYSTDYHKLETLCSTVNKPTNFYHYFDFLPLLNKDNIVSLNEGAVPIEEWSFLSEYARRNFSVDCRVVVCRNDLNGSTGTFKDISASLAASLFKEHGVKEYCLASTGNAGTSYSTYLAEANVKFHLFSPKNIYQDTQDAVRETGQDLVISDGNYGTAKKEASEFHKANNVMISSGNTDPIRVEAKKTLVFECLRQLGRIPDVYMQAVAGGTGPIAFKKGMDDIKEAFPEYRMPRMLLVQQDTCDPMVQAWEWAATNSFPDGYENHFPSLEPKTKISILSAGTPGMYPIVGPIVRNSNGSFIRINESELVEYGRIVKNNRGVIMGPASIVCVAGFYQALKENKINNGDLVLLNTGEGCERAKWFKKEIESRPAL